MVLGSGLAGRHSGRGPNDSHCEVAMTPERKRLREQVTVEVIDARQ